MAVEYLAPLITSLFFLSVTLAGIYIYCCYIRAEKKEDTAQTVSTVREKKYFESLSPDFFNHMYPIPVALPSSDLSGIVNVRFSSSPLISPTIVKDRKAKGIDGEMFQGRPLFFRSMSHDPKWVNFHCQLQVIQEVNEEEISDGEFSVGKYVT